MKRTMEQTRVLCMDGNGGEDQITTCPLWADSTVTFALETRGPRLPHTC